MKSSWRLACALVSTLLLSTCVSLSGRIGPGNPIEEKPVTNEDTSPANAQNKPRFTERNIAIESYEKEWTITLYVAGVNNLYPFVEHNIHEQLSQVGISKHANFVAQIDQYDKKNMQRVEVHKGEVKVVYEEPRTKNNPSGTPKSLYNCLKWSLTNYPAKRHMLLIWDHGSGIMDPHRWGRGGSRETRGIAFNDAYGEYLTNQDLAATLSLASENLLGGKKFDIIAMDTCDMAMVEVSEQCQQWCDYLIFSQDVILGPGWNYKYAFEILEKQAATPKDLCLAITQAYRKEYAYITNDYTLSAVDTAKTHELVESLNTLGTHLAQALKGEHRQTMINIIKKIRTREKYTTSFYGDNYIDLNHFYISLLAVTKQHLSRNTNLYAQLMQDISRGMYLLSEAVISNVAGPAQPFASGLSIYFPYRNLHSSYIRTTFGAHNAWRLFLESYLGRARSENKE